MIPYGLFNNANGDVITGMDRIPRYISPATITFDTLFGYPTHGYFAEYYNSNTLDLSTTFQSGDMVVQGKENILAYDWGIGVPPGINTKLFKTRFYGYFTPPANGRYFFFVVKEPKSRIRFYLDKSNTVKNLADAAEYDALAPTNLFKLDDWVSFSGVEIASGFTGSTMSTAAKPFLLEYYHTEPYGYLSLMYQRSGTSFVIPMSGAVTSTILKRDGTSDQYAAGWYGFGNQNPLTPLMYQSCDKNNISLSKSYNQSSILEIEAPLLKFETEYDLANASGVLHGFYYDKNKSTYMDNFWRFPWKLGYLVKFFCGYLPTGTNPSNEHVNFLRYYIPKFVGIITDISTDKTGGSADSIKIKCQDILYRPMNTIFENYPNKLSYAMNFFTTDNTPGQPNGITRPQTYDGWPLDRVVIDLLITK